MTKVDIAKFNEKYGITNLNTKWFEFENKTEQKSTEIPGKPTKIITDIFKRFFKNKWNIVFFSILVSLILFIIIGKLTAPYGPHEKVLNSTTAGGTLEQIQWLPSNIGHSGTSAKIITMTRGQWDLVSHGMNANAYEFVGPSSIIGYVEVKVMAGSDLKNNIIMGTESQGYDIWSRIMHGSAFSLTLAFTVATIETVVGIAIGAYVGFHAGKTLDTLVMRLIDTFSSIPSLVWLIIIVGVLPKSLLTLMIALLITGWIGPVYSTRIYIISIKDREFIKAAALTGASKLRVIFVHALPNILGRLTVQYVHRIPAVVFAEASIFFILGSTFMEGTVSLGTIIDDARQFITPIPNIWYLITPILIMSVLTISLQIISNGLRDAMDPKVMA